MSYTMICYPRCSTCKKAERWMQEQGIDYTYRDIQAENPTQEELKEWHGVSGLPLKRFFNTSGQLYRSMALKDRLSDMSEEEQYALLSTDGLLVKRPILLGPDFVLTGFREKEWRQRLGLPAAEA